MPKTRYRNVTLVLLFFHPKVRLSNVEEGPGAADGSLRRISTSKRTQIYFSFIPQSGSCQQLPQDQPRAAGTSKNKMNQDVPIQEHLGTLSPRCSRIGTSGALVHDTASSTYSSRLRAVGASTCAPLPSPVDATDPLAGADTAETSACGRLPVLCCDRRNRGVSRAAGCARLNLSPLVSLVGGVRLDLWGCLDDCNRVKQLWLHVGFRMQDGSPGCRFGIGRSCRC